VANHLTPTELAHESGMQRAEVLSKCIELGVPVFQGRIDKSLFLASLQDRPELPAWGAPAAHADAMNTSGPPTANAA
jgi:hypothetical protein